MTQTHQYQRVFDPTGDDSLSMLARHVKPGTNILELGPATGYFTRYLHDELKCAVDAVEIDPTMANQVRPSCRRLVIGNLEQLQLNEQFAGNRYDAIVFGDVLEHLRDPLATLRQAVQLLADDGQVLISVPNVAYGGLIADLLQGEFAYRDEGLLDHTHLHFFTRTSLDRMLRDAGLHVWQWQAMERPLWDSEFRTRLETLPAAWVETLLGQPHALCYQWVAAARKTAPPQEPPLPAMGGRDRFPVRLFWRAAPEGFEFPRSQVAWGEVGESGQTLVFTLPSGSYEQLRLSLADRPGFVRLHAISLQDLAGTPLWQWQAGEELTTDGANGVHGRMQDGNYHLLLHDAQSWVNLPIPLSLPKAGLRLAITLDWPISADYAALLPLVRDEVDSLRGELETARRTVDERDGLLELRAAQATEFERLIAERERLIEERDALLELRNTQITEREALIVERDGILDLRNTQIAEREQAIAERNHVLTERDIQITALQQQLEYRASMVWWLKSPLRFIKRAITGKS